MPPMAERYPTVLVADDDELLRFAVRIALESDGCHVLEVGSGAEAAEVVNAQSVDAIIIDAHMPGWSLIETLDALRPSAETRGLAVIVISGATVELGDHGSFVVSVLRKPVALETLKTVVRSTAVNQNSARPERIW
jgi:CheY-like chemotaxis protein